MIGASGVISTDEWFLCVRPPRVTARLAKGFLAKREREEKKIDWPFRIRYRVSVNQARYVLRSVSLSYGHIPTVQLISPRPDRLLSPFSSLCRAFSPSHAAPLYFGRPRTPGKKWKSAAKRSWKGIETEMLRLAAENGTRSHCETARHHCPFGYFVEKK